MIDIKVSKDVFEDAFPEAYDNHGYVVCGTHRTELEEEWDGRYESLKELSEALPEKIFNENKNFTLIPEYNVKKFFRYQILTPYSEEMDGNNYREMVKVVELDYPEHIETSMSGKIIDEEFSNKIIEYAYNEEMNNSYLTVNDTKIMIAKYENKNWAKEYIDSIKK